MNPWVAGARPRTLPAAIVPVAVGTAAAVVQLREDGAVDVSWDGDLTWWKVFAALVVALALQVAVNYANDYSDGIRGTDDDDARVGPLRLVGSGAVEARLVKRAAFIAFGLAGVAGGLLALAVGPELLVVGAASILAGWFYTGGPRPYGYLGLGELFVFVFFGLVATAGTTYVLTEQLTALSLLWGCALGALACALLVVNNLRDIPGDTVVGKRTLAVRLGDGRTRFFYVGLVVAAFALAALIGAGRPFVLVTLLAALAAVAPIRRIMGGAVGADLIAVLGDTGRLQLVFGLLAAVTTWLTA